jgi:hypothetical protein
VPEAGTYDGRINLPHSFDYGIVEFELNGEPVGKQFNGQLDNVVFGDGVVFNEVQLRKGVNHLSITNVGRSTKPLGYKLGIESLEFTRK